MKKIEIDLDSSQKLLNFKEFYENSKLNIPSTKSSYESKSTSAFQRSRSSVN